MPDNKLTDVTDNNVGKISDNEIIKALECCNQNDCKTCPYGKYNTAGWCCMPKLRKDTLDLINHLQEENERLKGIKTTDWLIKGISAEQLEKEKIEALEDNAYRLGKAEAYKEFADRLETKLFIADDNLNPVVTKAEIDGTYKELVGEDK